jgi:hypothetical protein
MAPPVDLNATIIPYPGPPAVWTYPSSSVSLTVGVPMTPLVPTIVSGVPYGWHVKNVADYPTTLPAGLVLDMLTGTLSGTPTLAQPARVYRITSGSKGGPTGWPLSITVT